MDSHDFQFEELHISKAICLSFHDLDLVVGALQGGSGNGVVVIGKDA